MSFPSCNYAQAPEPTNPFASTPSGSPHGSSGIFDRDQEPVVVGMTGVCLEDVNHVFNIHARKPAYDGWHRTDPVWTPTDVVQDGAVGWKGGAGELLEFEALLAEPPMEAATHFTRMNGEPYTHVPDSPVIIPTTGSSTRSSVAKVNLPSSFAKSCIAQTNKVPGPERKRERSPDRSLERAGYPGSIRKRQNPSKDTRDVSRRVEQGPSSEPGATRFGMQVNSSEPSKDVSGRDSRQEMAMQMKNAFNERCRLEPIAFTPQQQQAALEVIDVLYTKNMPDSPDILAFLEAKDALKDILFTNHYLESGARLARRLLYPTHCDEILDDMEIATTINVVEAPLDKNYRISTSWRFAECLAKEEMTLNDFLLDIAAGRSKIKKAGGSTQAMDRFMERISRNRNCVETYSKQHPFRGTSWQAAA